jgi:CRISPR-associated protein Cas2
MLYAIAYDIADDRRRHRVHEALKDFGRRVQYSVFECDLKSEEIGPLARRIETEMDEEADSCRFYRLCEACRAEVRILGKGDQYREPEVVIV